jgi:hypothetical protein
MIGCIWLYKTKYDSEEILNVTMVPQDEGE